MTVPAINWEALTVALESVRINTIAGRTTQAHSELDYLLDTLHTLWHHTRRSEEVEQS